MNKNSRYIKGGTVDNINKPGFWTRTIFPKSSDDITFILSDKYSQKPYLVAYDLYGTAELGWFVLQYNDIIDATTEFVSGKTITLPTPKKLSIGMI